MRDTLLATVDDEHATVEAFASLLAVEAKALTAVALGDTLPPLIEQKQELIDKLAALEKQREAQLVALGLPSGKRGMEQATGRDARLAGRWNLLQRAIERARQANVNNGLLIRIRMNYNSRALSVLRAIPDRPGFYGPDGRALGSAALR
jgi:flagellar biosynthesis protein FlgN